MNRKERRAAGSGKGGRGPSSTGPSLDPRVAARFEQAIGLHRSGRVAEAEVIYREILVAAPAHAAAHHFLGACRQSFGDLEGAIRSIHRSVELDGNNALFRHNLGNCLALAGRAADAIAEQHRAVELKPDYAEAWKGLGDAMRLAGRLDDALDPYRRALALNPAYPDALNNLGIALIELGRPEIAEPEFRKALGLMPAYAEAWHNLGLALARQGLFAEAETAYNKAVELKPDYGSAWRGLANLCRLTGRGEASIDLYRRAISFSPEDWEAHTELGAALMVLGRFTESVNAYGAVYDHDPSNTIAVNNLSAALLACQRLAETDKLLTGAIERNPDAVDLYTNLAYVRMLNGQVSTVVDLCRTAIARDPMRPAIWSNMAAALFEQGDVEGCLKSVRRALEIDPLHNDASINYLYFLSRSVTASPEEVLEAHKNWRARMCKDVVALPRRRPSTADQGRRLRIGYISGDFRSHSVSYFIEPVLRHHDRSKVEVFCYSNCTTPDEVTVRISRIADGWRPVWGLTDLEVAQMIRSDGIDILVDLSGFTQANRIKVPVYRPAPVQVTYLGYFTTTGIHEINHWISDHILHPADTVEQTVENIWRLNRCWVSYQPHRDAPDVRPGPLSRGEPVTFGSFNATSKLTPKTLGLWGRVLRALPESRLLLKSKNLIDGPERDRIIGLLVKEGIALDRVEIRHHKDSHRDHHNAYGDMDLSLDTAPLTGGTTTADALWMGVPVVTLAGKVMIERMSASMLHAMGLGDWIATTEDEYVEKAVRFASDPAMLMRLREGQRQAAKASPLFDAKGLTQTLEESYATMFADWRVRNGN